MPRRAKRETPARPPRKVKRKSPRTRRKSLRIPRPWPGARTRHRLLRAFGRLPGALQILVGLAVLATLGLALNFAYQVIRKPSELFFPVSGTLYKTPAETWRSYEPIFRRHATTTMTPQFLAALAQIEGSGNPIVRTYWRLSFSPKPFEIYRPASSAVGMYQITDGTFAQARHFCIHDHVVVQDGPWDDLKSCWFNSLYTRTIPSNAVELTSAYLDRQVAAALAQHGIRNATLRQKQNLAALIHLCGAGADDRYVRHGLHTSPGQRCGDHDAAEYIAKVSRMRDVFERLAGP